MQIKIYSFFVNIVKVAWVLPVDISTKIIYITYNT